MGSKELKREIWWNSFTLKSEAVKLWNGRTDRVSFQSFHLLFSSQFLRHSFLLFLRFPLFPLISFLAFHSRPSHTTISHFSPPSSPSLPPFRLPFPLSAALSRRKKHKWPLPINASSQNAKPIFFLNQRQISSSFILPLSHFRSPETGCPLFQGLVSLLCK